MKPTETIEVPIPDVADLDLKVPGPESFDSIVERRQIAQEQIKNLKVQVAECDIQIGAVLDLNQIRAVAWRSQYVVSRREGSAPRKSIDATKLISLGVAPSVIQAATVLGKPGSPGVTIRRVGEKEKPESVDGYFN